MIAWLFRKWREAHCEHDWELISDTTVVWDPEDAGGRVGVPKRAYRTYRCRKCGYAQQIDT